MPQLDPSTFAPQLFWLAVTFIALYLLMKHFALPQVGKALAARRERLEEDLARAGQIKAEAEAVLAAYQTTLGAARAQAQARLKETSDRLAAEAGERQRALAESLAKDIAAAERRIAAAKQRALADICGLAGDLARSIADRLTAAADEDGGAAERAMTGPPR